MHVPVAEPGLLFFQSGHTLLSHNDGKKPYPGAKSVCSWYTNTNTMGIITISIGPMYGEEIPLIFYRSRWNMREGGKRCRQA